MARFISTFLLSVFCLLALKAQEGCQIKVRLQSYYTDTLWFGETYGKRCVPDFFAVKNADGTFDLKTEKPLKSGMYAIIYKRAPKAAFQSIPCWIADGQRNFSIETDVFRLYENPVVKGSLENERFYQYLREFDEKYDRLDSLTEVWRYTWDEHSFRQKVKAEEEMLHFQEDFIQKNPGSLSAELVSQTLYTLPPTSKKKAANWQEEANEQWCWQRQHFFDRMDISKPEFLIYPQWLERTDYLIFHLSPPYPDSSIAVLNDVIQRLQPNVDGYQYYMKYLINSLKRVSRYQADEVFAYLIRNYVEKGKTPWLEQTERDNLSQEANRMEPLFYGKQVPNVTLYDKQESPVTLHDIQSPFTLLVFWQPDCSHCKRELPALKRIYASYKDKGLKIVTICGKYRNDVPKCYEFLENEEMPSDWVNLSDPQARSGMATLFYVRSYPRIFILDAQKNILFKRNGEVPEPELVSVLERLMGSRR